MRKFRPTGWHLASAAGALAFVAAFAWSYVPDNRSPGAAALVAILAVMLITELPALWWRRQHGGRAGTLVAALAGPLLLFEGFLAYGAWVSRDTGGDLQGIHQVLMLLVLVPILVTGILMAVFAILLVDPGEGAE